MQAFTQPENNYQYFLHKFAIKRHNLKNNVTILTESYEKMHNRS